jgi:hypothetical protein
MPFTLRHLPLRSGFVLLSMLALCSCAELSDLFGPDKVPVQEPQKKYYDTPAFVSSLSYSKLVLENGGTLKDVRSDMKVVESYGAIKRTKPVTLPLVVLDYKTSTLGSTRRLAVYTGKDGQDLAAMDRLMKRLESYGSTLQEIAVLSVPVSNKVPLKLSKLDADQVSLALKKPPE